MHYSKAGPPDPYLLSELYSASLFPRSLRPGLTLQLHSLAIAIVNTFYDFSELSLWASVSPVTSITCLKGCVTNTGSIKTLPSSLNIGFSAP